MLTAEAPRPPVFGEVGPRRVQRRRVRGWRMPPNTVYVGRPSRWGNDFRPDMPDMHDDPLGHERAVELYRLATIRWIDEGDPYLVRRWLLPLRGKNLACWCPLYMTCHADVLLELANR